MAKYTELFAEYLESGGELPAAFDEIYGFKDLFIGHFFDKENGTIPCLSPFPLCDRYLTNVIKKCN